MSTSLRLITSNLITRYFPPTVVSASRFLTTMPKDDFEDQSLLRIPCPKISSMAFQMSMTGEKRSLRLQLPNESMNLELKMPAGLKIKDMRMRACAEHNTSSHIKEEMKDGVLKLTLPNKDGINKDNFINNIIAGFRDIAVASSWPYYDFYDQSSLRIKCPEISSMSLGSWMYDDIDRIISIDIPNEGLSIELEMWRLEINRDMRVCAEHNASDIKDEMKEDIMANIVNNTIASFRDITTECGWQYYDMFYDRSILAKGLCPIIANLSQISSFSLFKEETAESLYITMDMPGEENMKLTTRGILVSSHMYGLKREDVKAFFDYDTFFIEGKTKTRHYITGIHLPEGIHMKKNMIRKKMEDGKFYAFLSCSWKSEGLHDQLKPKSCITN